MGRRTPRRDRFPLEYLLDLNGQEAAIRSGYSRESAASIACHLLAEPDIQAEVCRLNAERIARLELSVDDAVREIYSIATADVAGAFDEDGALLPVQDWPAPLRRACSGFEVAEVKVHGQGEDRTETTIRKARFWSKDKNLDMLMRHLSGYAPTKHVVADASYADLLAGADEPEPEESDHEAEAEDTDSDQQDGS